MSQKVMKPKTSPSRPSRPAKAGQTPGQTLDLVAPCTAREARCGHYFASVALTAPVAVQAKLAISQPGDVYEQEADRVAEEVLRMPEEQVLQRKCLPCGEDEDEDEVLQTKEVPGSTPAVGSMAGVPPLVHEVIRSPGQPLDPATRAFFEPRIGHDFSQVRVHTDEKSAESADTLYARAYALGNDVVFNTGEYRLDTPGRKRLLAHELTHVVHQYHNNVRMIQRAEVDDNPAFCFPGREGVALQDVSGHINRWIVEARRTAEANALHIVNAVYQNLGSGGVRSRVEERLAGLPQTHVRHVRPAESRYRGQQWFPGIAAQLRTRRLAPVVNLCGVCVGADKLGHFFAQGYEYFRIGQRLRQRVRSWSREQRERFEQRVTPPLPAEIQRALGSFSEILPSETTEARFEITEEYREDRLVEIYTNEFGKWLEGFEHRLPPEEVRWIRRFDVIPSWYHEGLYAESFSGVLSRADLVANDSGGRFYIDFWRNPTQNPNICDYVNGNWNEHHYLSTFVELPTPTGPRSRSSIAEEP